MSGSEGQTMININHDLAKIPCQKMLEDSINFQEDIEKKLKNLFHKS